MIRSVTDRIASRSRPAYKGRHRRTRAGSAPAGPAPAPERGEAAEPRREAEPALAAPLAPCA